MKRLKILKINNYFILAVILSWVVLFVGFSIYVHMYQTEIPFSRFPSTLNNDDFNKLTNNGTNSHITSSFVCISQQKRDYFSKWDVLICNLTNELSGTNYTLSRVHVIETLINMTQNENYWVCDTNNSCQMYLYTRDNAFGFVLAPEYKLESETISPVYYYFEIKKLRDWKDMDNLEQNKLTLLIAIITAALLTVWAGIYYAKKILE